MGKLFVILASFFFVSVLNAQVSTQLATITVGSPNNSAGLGISFDGQVLSDGFLYFEGSPNGLKKSIWKTDGTKIGTKLVVEEASTFGNDWERIIFTKDGILVFDKKVWKLLRSNQNSLVVLSNMPSAIIDYFMPITNGEYFATFRVGNDLVLYSITQNFSNVQQIGSFNPSGNSILTTSGTHGAVTYNNNVFGTNTPMIYLKSQNKITTLIDFVKTIDPSVVEAKEGLMHDEFLILNYATSTNSFVRKIVNLATMEIKDFQNFRNLLEFKNYGDYFIMITKEDVIKIKKDDLSNQNLFSDVFAFTPTALIKNKLYLIEYINNKESIVEINLDDNKINALPNSETGTNFYDSKFISYKDEFYFLKENSHQLLMKYDFNTQTAKTIDSLSLNTGATVIHNLFSVKGNLVFSKRLGFLQHEPFVLGAGTTSTKDLNVEFLAVFPVPAQNEINLDIPLEDYAGNYTCRIINMSSNDSQSCLVSNNRLEISHLSTGSYIGEVIVGSQNYFFKFVKI